PEHRASPASSSTGRAERRAARPTPSTPAGTEPAFTGPRTADACLARHDIREGRGGTDEDGRCGTNRVFERLNIERGKGAPVDTRIIHGPTSLVRRKPRALRPRMST